MKKLAIIDTFALLHRAWHAIPTLTTKDGTMVNAVYGFSSIFLKLLKDLNPDYVVAAFDLPHETFRHKAFKEYKAQREAPDPEFINQIGLVEEVLKALNVPILAKPGYEADDVIGSVAKHLNTEHPDIDVVIVTGDLDTLQLINANTTVYTSRKGIIDTTIYDEASVKERYGLTPDQIIDLKSLKGDASDNIPGVKGIGEKGAITLVQRFKDLDGIYEHLDDTSISERTRAMLTEQKESAYQSRMLATIVTDLSVKLDLSKAQVSNFDIDKATEIFQKFEFRSLLAKLPNSTKVTRPQRMTTVKKYRVIDSPKNMQALAQTLSTQSRISVDTETTGLDTQRADLLGASFAWDQEAVFVHTRTSARRKDFVKHFGPILANQDIKKIGHNLKYDLEILARHGMPMNGIGFDTLIAAYLLNTDRSLKLEELAFSYLGLKMQTLAELAGSTKKKDIDVAAIDPEKLAQYGAADADAAYHLAIRLEKELKKENLEALNKSIELPLIPIIGAMEQRGISVDADYLKVLDKQLVKQIASIEKKVHAMSGSDFNLASPTQLKEILFEKLQIATTGIKRTKTGLSTAADVLEKLKDAHPIVPLILDYRELTKLLNTYVTPLPDLMDENGRVHTSYNQTVTATGRLSSSYPNLQNIPIRTELGRTIRKAFRAPRGYQLISADYSQIELRLAAVISKDERMLASFTAGEDIHRRTAAEMNGISLEEVTSTQRRNAKEVNFGVLYGLGSTGLAQRTGLSRLEAKEFISRYFSAYEGVKAYVDSTKSFAHENGYVQTQFGRKRRLPEIFSSSPMLVAQAERMAVNMPLQGTAADIMKLAMIACDTLIAEKFPQAHMLLQVHDELVFEVPNDQVAAAAQAIKTTMESVVQYPIPLTVDVATGTNWADLEDLPS